MKRWQQIAIKRIDSAIHDVTTWGEFNTGHCPVCDWMASRKKIVKCWYYDGGHPVNTFNCPAEEGCKRFCVIAEL